MRTLQVVKTLLFTILSIFALAVHSESEVGMGTGGAPKAGSVERLQAGDAPLDTSPPSMAKGLSKSLASGLYMTGQFTYSLPGFSGGTASITLNGITNASSTTTGTLRLELWATVTYPARDTSFLGYRLATFAPLSPLAPQASYSNIAQSATFTAPPNGQYWVILILEQYDPANCSVLDAYYCTQDTFNSFNQTTWGLAAPSTSEFINISTRGPVLTGNNVMIAGFVIGGTAPQRVVIVATGPSLAAFGIVNPLANPTLTLVRSSDQSVIATNDDWQNQSASSVTAIQASGFAPSNSLESAILVTLNPGAYTAIMSGVGGGTGVGVVAVYAAP